VIVIAHRLSTIRHADQIIVLDEGKVIQKGEHEALLREGGLYSELYNLQFDSLKRASNEVESSVSGSY